MNITAQDIAEECLTAAASPDWPLCVVGVTLGASLRLRVTKEHAQINKAISKYINTNKHMENNTQQ